MASGFYSFACSIHSNGKRATEKGERMRVCIPDFTVPEINHIKAFANFSKREERLFDLRNQGKTLEECAEVMEYSVATVNRISRKMVSKIIKIL